MKNKNIYTIIGLVIIVLAGIIIVRSNKTSPVSQNPEQKIETSDQSSVSKPATKSSPTTKGGQSSVSSPVVVRNSVDLPDIDFINQRVSLNLKDFPDVKMTIEKVAFGRGETVVSTGCSGIPNANFSTYLYPGSGICIGKSEVDGSPMGVVAFHVLLENNGQFGFGGNANAIKLHYLRSDASGKPVSKFAIPLIDMGSYYINQSASKVVVLSYLVPEDQLIYDLVVGYKEPSLEKKGLNVYDFSTNGFLTDFGSKTLKIIK